MTGIDDKLLAKPPSLADYELEGRLGRRLTIDEMCLCKYAMLNDMTFEEAVELYRLGLLRMVTTDHGEFTGYSIERWTQ